MLNPFLVKGTRDVKWFMPKGFNKNTTEKHKDNTLCTTAKESIPLYQTNESPINKKQKLHHAFEGMDDKCNIKYHELILAKKVKLTETSHDQRYTDEPHGLIWDGQHHCCSYDSFLNFREYLG